MIKISFWLKKPNSEQGNLEYITIGNPKKFAEGKLTGLYACEVCLPETEKKLRPIYADNPIEAVCLASDFAKNYLQAIINKGCIISEVENKEIWKLEKKDPIVNLREKLNNKDLTPEGKQEILDILKNTFGKLPHMKDQINKFIEEEEASLKN